VARDLVVLRALRVLRNLLTPRRLVPSDEPPNPVVVGMTLAAGSVALGATLATPRGSVAFTVLGLVVATIWIVGTFLTSDHPLGLHRRSWTAAEQHMAMATRRARGRHWPVAADDGTGWSLDRAQVLGAIGLGVLAWLGFLAAEWVAEQISVLDNAVESILDRAETGPLAVVLGIALLNAVAEEVFFRGALLEAIGPRWGPVAATGIYVAVTATSLNLALVLAAVAMGVLWMVERQATGTPLAPVLTHITWSTLMLLAFPG
jgi:membrane protease YdiL (CAAX protease family)